MVNNNDDALAELRRQFEVVRRRIDETVRRLAAATEGITADGLEGVEAATWAEGKGDLFQLCVRLEVALAASSESADRLTRRLRQLTPADPQMTVGLGRLYAEGPGERHAWQN